MTKWLDDAIFYEIYPQSFNDTNGDGIGDLQGIIEKLDYIKGLGCNAIWMNPCFQSPFGDAGYDVEDYYKVAPRYGTNEDLKKLIEEVHKRDMHILLDLVPGHTAVTHPWFQESMKAERNEFTDRYVWTNAMWDDQMKDVLPDGMPCIKGISDRDGSCVVNFFSHQPALNYGFYQPDPNKKWQQSMNDEGPIATREAMKDVMRFWLTMGCDGFRVDMAHSMIKGDPEGKGNELFWENVSGFLAEEFPHAVMVAEWGEPDKSLKSGFHMDFLIHCGDSHYMDLFHSKDCYFDGSGKGDASAFVKKYEANMIKSEGKGLMCVPSGNHDLHRMTRFIDSDRNKIVFTFLLSMPGAPFIYYGDEIGMRFLEGVTSVEGGYIRTGTRSPMQWDSGVNAGFSSGRKEDLYIPIDPDENRPTVEKQMADETSLYHEVEKLIQIRKEHKALHNRSKIRFVYAEEKKYPLVYLRECEDEKILVVINPSDKDETFACEYELQETIYSLGEEATVTNGVVNVPAKSAGFYRV